jgi:hypothetical protein
MLTVLVILGQLMQAFDPYNLGLVGETALCCSEVVAMAHRISEYRPLGASHVPLTLAIAWAATEEPGLKAQLEQLLSEYQEDWCVTQWTKIGQWWSRRFADLRERLAPKIESDQIEMLMSRVGNVRTSPPAEECCVM